MPQLHTTNLPGNQLTYEKQIIKLDYKLEYTTVRRTMVCEKNDQKSVSEKDKYMTVATKLRKMETNLEVAHVWVSVQQIPLTKIISTASAELRILNNE